MARAVVPEARKPAPRSSAPEARTGEGEEAAPKDRAVFAVDNDHKVVIRILDSKGKLIMQIPPEEAHTLQEKMGETLTNLYSREA